jgi:4-hydroxy-3-methylbut-2-enyl diphosphate reductase IspH
VSIESSKGSAASVASVLRGESKAGYKLLEHDGLVAIPDLHYSSQAGVLVFSTHGASAARAHAAAHKHHGR